MSATQERDQVARIARSDNASALRIARNIDDPWFRCQALAYVAWNLADHKRFLRVVAESLESGWSIRDPNRSVTVIAWPVAALARRNYSRPDAMERSTGILRDVIARLTGVIAKEPNPASRADALLLHVHALSPSRRELRKGLLGLLVKECRDATNQKRQRQLEEAAMAIAPDDLDTALGLIASLDENRKRRTTVRIEAQGEGLGPRQFFEKSGDVR
ncbi:MAG TPA: hypothetical protein VGP76_08845 [Planctomycetaceae bacterium]|jgi:hypothetical protein|nr:hypothetical protein [Planctomycetaceae bacterium]